jgi:AraC-like DNA-binding protein
MNFLTTSGAYTNPNLSAAMLSVETGISTRNISTAINAHLGKNFFHLINEMRLNEAKKRLRVHGDHFTIESVAEDCGFRSYSSFYNAFKEAEGKTPLQWMKKI